MSDNTTQWPTNSTTNGYDFDWLGFLRFLKFLVGFGVILSVAGTVVNVWFLVAVLRSVDLRSRLRNKLICNVFVLHLVNSVVILPTGVASLLLIINGNFYSCHINSFVTVIMVIQDIITNWLLVMQIIVFIAQIVDFNPEAKLTPQVVKFGTWALLIVPWILTVMIVLITLYVYHKDILQHTNGCVYLTLDMEALFKIFDMIAPLSITIILLLIAAFLKYKGIRCGNWNGSMLNVLVGQSSVTDSIFVYVAAVAVALVCDFTILVLALDWEHIRRLEQKTVNILLAFAFLLSHGRVVLMVLPWLLLPDIRDRIKTWRPWHKPGPGIDLTATYKKEEGDG